MSKRPSDYICSMYTATPDSLKYREFGVENLTGEESEQRLDTESDFFWVKLALINEYRS